LSIGEQLGGRGAFQISYRYFRLGNALIFDLVLISEEGHTHSPKTFVQQVEATCLQNGIKAHYICDCKMAFLDEACTNRVIDDTALKIPVRAHTPSGYKNNRADHWKECTECGSEIADSHGTHGDQNGDNRCDICSYALPITGSGNSGVGSETPGSTGSASADNSDTPTTTVGDADASSSQENSTEHTEDNAGDSAETVGDESTSTTVSDGSETAEQKEPSATVEETPVCEDSADHNSWKAAIWLCAGIVVVASGVGAALILFKKKKK